MFNQLLATSGSAIVDVVALVFVALFMIKGFTSGFAKTLISMFGSVFSLLFAVLLSSTVAGFLESEFSLVTTISSGLEGSVGKLFGEELMGMTVAQATESSLGQTGISGWILSLIILFKEEGSIPQDTLVSQVVCPTLAYYITTIISVMALFILFKILFFLLGKLAKKLHEIKLVAVVDKTLGLALGIISGVVYLELIIMIISIIPISFVQDIYAHIQSSTVAGFISNINLFEKLTGAISISDVITFVKGILQ